MGNSESSECGSGSSFQKFKQDMKNNKHIGFSISKLDALCGQGKTRGIVEYIHNSYDENILYIAQSIALIEETKERLGAIDYTEVKVIHSKNESDKSVKEQLNECFKEMKDRKKPCYVVLMTWESYISNNLNRNNDFDWITFIDELPPLFRNIKKTIFKRRSEELTEYVELKPYVQDILTAKPVDRKKLKNKLKNPPDDFEKVLYEVFRYVMNPSYDVYVKKRNDDYYFVALLRPEVLSSFGSETTIVGANLNNSLFFNLFKSTGIPQSDNRSIKIDSGENLGYPVKCYYYSKKKKWSKYLKDRNNNESVKYNQIMADVIQANLTQEDFLLAENKEYKTSLNDKDGCVVLPYDPRGLNDYRDYSEIVFLASYNHDPVTYDVIKTVYGEKYPDFDEEGLEEYLVKDNLYQAVMRGVLRNKGNSDEMIVHVPVKKYADMLRSYAPFRNMEIEYVKGFDEKIESKGVDKKKTPIALTSKINADAPEIIIHRYSKVNEWNDPSRYGRINFKDFKALKTYMMKAKKEVRSKQNVDLFCGSDFNSGESPFRDSRNFKSTSILVLDVDGGSFTRSKLKQVFESKRKPKDNLSYFAYSTFSHGVNRKDRFRVIFPLNQAVNTTDDYGFIFKVIVDRIATSLGKPVTELGIDKTSKSPVHGYYLPCVNKDHPDRWFFDENEIENTDKYIDVAGILANKVEETDAAIAEQFFLKLNDDALEDKTQKYLDEYRGIPAGRGLRYDSFFILGLKLYTIHQDLSVVRQYLKIEANGEDKIVKRIDGVIKTLEKK